MSLPSCPHLPSWRRLSTDAAGESALTLVFRLVLEDADPSAILCALEACGDLRGVTPSAPGGNARLLGPAADLIASRCRRPTMGLVRILWAERGEDAARLLGANPFVDGVALNGILQFLTRQAHPNQASQPQSPKLLRYVVAAGARRGVLTLDAVTLDALVATLERPHYQDANGQRVRWTPSSRLRDLAWLDALQDAHLDAARGRPVPSDAALILDWQRGLVDQRADGAILMEEGDGAGGDIAQHPDASLALVAGMVAAWPSEWVLRGTLGQMSERRDAFLRHPAVRAEFVAQMAGSQGGIYARYLLMHPDPADSALAFEHFAFRHDGTLDVALVESLLEDPETPPETFTALGSRWLVAALAHTDPAIRVRALLATRGVPPAPLPAVPDADPMTPLPAARRAPR